MTRHLILMAKHLIKYSSGELWDKVSRSVYYPFCVLPVANEILIICAVEPLKQKSASNLLAACALVI